MSRLTVALLLLYAFAVPWQYALDLGEPLGNVARIVGAILLIVAIPAAIARNRWNGPGALPVLVLALFLYLSATYLWSIDPLTTLDKIRAYFQVMMVVWVGWEFLETPAHFRNLLRALLLGSIVLAALTLSGFTSAAAAVATEQARFTASGQDPNDVARFLDLIFPIAALLVAEDDRLFFRALAALYLPLGLLAVVLTASRGGFLGATVAFLVALFLLARWKRAAVGIASFLLAALATAAFFLVPPETFARLATIPGQFASLDFNDRFAIWTACGQAFARAPWFGYGAGNYSLAAGLSAEDTAHNTFMALLVMGGLVAAVLLVAILIVALHAILRRSGLVRIAFLGVLLVWIVTANVGSVEENRMTWLIFACFALLDRFAVDPDLPHRRVGRTAPLQHPPAMVTEKLSGAFTPSTSELA